MATTTRWANRYPALADAADVPLWMQRLAEDLDNVAKDTQGLLSARPSAATAKYGAWYYATDTGDLARSDGANWIVVVAGISQTNEIGDYKMSAQVADHGTLGGGKFRWLRLDSPARTPLRADYPLLWDLFRQGTSNSPFGNGNGTTTFTLPDAAGRVPVVKGSNTDVSTFGNSDGLAVASRKIKHRHGRGSLGASTQIHYNFGPGGAIGDLPYYEQAGHQFDTFLTHGTALSGEIGDTNGPLDAPAHIVVGNMFIKAA